MIRIKNAWQWLKSPRALQQGQGMALGLGLATALMSAWALRQGVMDRMENLALASALLLSAAFLAPRLLAPAAWLVETAFLAAMRLAMNLLLAITFFLVFAPVGLALRVLGKDWLDAKIDRSAKSYWKERPPADPRRAEKQF